mmetsp:Transcript_99035/g.258193  ORF Transcript_99035/g.258193 Transcript_99035/m.258193 type:complete len:277 (-) Transcript_99035:55-885(-)
MVSNILVKRPERNDSQVCKADTAVHADDLAIQIPVVDDRGAQVGELFCQTEPLRRCNLSKQAVLHFLGSHLHQRSVNDSGRNGHDTDTVSGEVARHGEGHPNHRSLGCGVHKLALLPLDPRHARHVDDDATASVLGRRGLRHGAGPVCRAVECAVRVEFHDEVKDLGLVRLQLFVESGQCHPQARAIDHAVQAPELCNDLLDGTADRSLLRDVGLAEKRAVSKPLRDLSALLALIQDADVGALAVEQLRGSEAEARRAARDHVGLASARHRNLCRL